MPSDMNDFDARFKRLYFRSQYRGTKELDILLGAFAEAKLRSLTPAELEQYEVLLEVGEATLFKWLNGQESPPHEHDTPVFRQIRAFLASRHD